MSGQVIYRCTVNNTKIETQSREEHLRNIQHFASKGYLVSSNILTE